jgi:hypothetical protein
MRWQWLPRVTGAYLPIIQKTLGFALVFAAFAGRACAADAAPEIDPGSATSALALLTCGMFMLTDRLRRK